MLFRYLPYLLVLALWIYAFIDCLNTPEEDVRHLPKVVWIIIVLLFGEVLVGPVAWLIAGRDRGVRAAGTAPSQRGQGTRWVAPDDDPAFLDSLRSSGPRAATGGPDEALLRDWEADLRRREEELRRRERGDHREQRHESGGGADEERG